jgi:orotate phosphoribosyltransferase
MPDRLVDLPNLLPSRRGHFRLESGHHGTLWLDVERLCLQVPPVEQFAGHLADALRDDGIEVVCGPLVDGAFVALLVASKLGVRFTYAERVAAPSGETLYPFHYRVPDPLRAEVHGRRVAIINDVINAGSAVRGTFIDLKSCGATVVALGAVAALGDWAARFAAGERLHLSVLETFANDIWAPEDCPMCANGEPLQDPLGAMGRR